MNFLSFDKMIGSVQNTLKSFLSAENDEPKPSSFSGERIFDNIALLDKTITGKILL